MAKRCQQFEFLLSTNWYSGAAISSTYAQFLDPGTTDGKNAWPDVLKSGSAFTKLALDSDGRGVAFGDGMYDVKLYAGDPDSGGTLLKTFEDVKCEAAIGGIAAKTDDYEITTDDSLLYVDTSSDDITLTFESSVANFNHPIVIVKTSALNKITINPYSTETLNTATYGYLHGLYETIVLLPNTTEWIGSMSCGGKGVVEVDSTDTITRHEHGNRIIPLTETGAAGSYTLPDAIGSGDVYEFVVGAVNTSNHVIRVSDGDHVMYGQIITCSTEDSPDLAQPWPTAADSDTITLNGTTTGGQAVGNRIVLTDIATNKWMVHGVTTTSGTQVTPFSADVA